MQLLARANLIFGLHVHVGIPDRESAIQVMNQTRYFLPHIYALSVNSPFWVGRNTGLKGYRLKVFERFPRTGIPGRVRIAFPSTKITASCWSKPAASIIAKKIWWDIRLHPFFDTLELRVCDAQSRVDDTLAHGRADPGDRSPSSTNCSGRIRPSAFIGAGCWMKIAGAPRVTASMAS